MIILPSTLLFVRHHDEADLPQCLFVRVLSSMTNTDPYWVLARIEGRIPTEDRCFRGAEAQDLGTGSLVHIAGVSLPDHPAMVRATDTGYIWDTKLRQPVDAFGPDILLRARITPVVE